ncbi:MAG TPA: hypothetical protein VLS89_18120, partial [Candidatus Nanopelagicales bacterium]|nr:hypothetical protein [Candidatus Nanopelagicales bacterium]
MRPSRRPAGGGRAARGGGALLTAALLLASSEVRAQICAGSNCLPTPPGAGAGGGGKGHGQGTVVWDPMSGQWVPQVNLGGQGGLQGWGKAPSAPPPQRVPPRYEPPRRRRRWMTFAPHLALGLGLGVQIGIADPEPRMLAALRTRWQPSRYFGTGVDFTYSMGEDDINMPPELHFYRHEFAAWPHITLHTGYHGGFSPYLRLGPNLGMVPQEGLPQDGTRTYLGGHFGFGFHFGLGRRVLMDIEHIGFGVGRLDDLPYPDGARTPGG